MERKSVCGMSMVVVCVNLKKGGQRVTRYFVEDGGGKKEIRC